MNKAIFLFDRSGLMAQPWLDAGYECWIFDGQHKPGITREGNLIKVGMWFNPNHAERHIAEILTMVGDGVKFVAGFPECTDLAVSGAAHFKAKAERDPEFQEKATRLAVLVEFIGLAFNCPWFAENPVSRLATLWRKPDFSFQPYEYGGYLPVDDIHPDYPDYIKPRDAYPKKTCIWCGNGFTKPTPDPVYCEPGYSLQHSKLGGKSLKTKNIRSCSPRGFALAVYTSRHP
ncbi:DNA cytosine methyltransferase [Salmonella enterica]|nr:DNA cytosine methyltransferase [Salmonella enterica]